MNPSTLRLKKAEDKRLRAGHPWIFSNEIDAKLTPLKAFQPGQEVRIEAFDQRFIGMAYVNPHSLITARLFSYDANARLDQAFFINQLNTALSLRERLFDQPYYRLAYSEADNLPGLIIDRFGNDLVLQINTAGMDSKTDIIIEALKIVLPETNSILLRNDSKIREQEGLMLETKSAFGTPPQQVLLKENGVSFNAPLWKGQKTGWFYDHLLNRARLAAYVKGKKVLDVFSYLGGWGIQAATFGATAVDCIDASATACEFIRENAKLNNVDQLVSVIHDDAFDALKKLQQAKNYDVIILDPPAFIKKAKDLKEGVIAYQRLNEMALKLLAEGGILISCSCSMHLSQEELIKIIGRAANRSGCKVQILERGHQGPDHPIHSAISETDYLKAVILRKISFL